MGKKLYVGNMSYDVDSSQLEEMFSAHGTVTQRRSDHRSRHRPQQGFRLRRDGRRTQKPGRDRGAERPGTRRPRSDRQRSQADAKSVRVAAVVVVTAVAVAAVAVVATAAAVVVAAAVAAVATKSLAR